MNQDLNKRTVEYSRIEQYHFVHPNDLNGGNRLFGGVLLQWIDEVAGMVGIRHAGMKSITTAAIDHLEFKAGAYLNDLVILVGYIIYTGHTSMEVRVDTYVEDCNGMRTPINRAYVVLVAIDANGKPVAVPPLAIENDIQAEEFRLAEQRKLQRKKNKYSI